MSKRQCVERFFCSYSMSVEQLDKFQAYLKNIKCPVFENGHLPTSECNCDKSGGCWTRSMNKVADAVLKRLADLKKSKSL